MQARRCIHRDVGPGPFRTVTGLWQPGGAPARLLLPLDATLYVLDEHAEERYRPPIPGFFAPQLGPDGEVPGASLEVADGRRLGTILAYDHPEVNPGNLRPYVEALPAAGLTGVPTFHACLERERFRECPEVRLLTPPFHQGNVVDVPRWEEYYAVAIQSQIQAARIRLPGVAQMPRAAIGAAAVLRDDERVLVGMVVEYRTVGGNCDALCYPAYLLSAWIERTPLRPPEHRTRSNGVGAKVGV